MADTVCTPVHVMSFRALLHRGNVSAASECPRATRLVSPTRSTLSYLQSRFMRVDMQSFCGKKFWNRNAERRRSVENASFHYHCRITSVMRNISDHVIVWEIAMVLLCSLIHALRLFALLILLRTLNIFAQHSDSWRFNFRRNLRYR